MSERISKLLSSLVLVNAVAAVGSYITSQSLSTWYADLAKPSFNPPNYLFGPVWTVLYLCMAVSLFLVWSTPLKKTKRNNDKQKTKNDALRYFGIQLLLNLFWTAAFFGLQNPELALAVIAFLWMAIYWTIKRFYPFSRTAAYLLIPYLLWVSFAAILNLFIVRLN